MAHPRRENNCFRNCTRRPGANFKKSLSLRENADATRQASAPAADTNPYQYTGREYDDTGMYFYRARYYSPIYQRFISEDPIGLVGGVRLYDYADNDPIDESDPTGLDPNSERCRSIRRRIKNIELKINERQEALRKNPLNLPGKCPGDIVKPSTSRRGHYILISKDKAQLAALRALEIVYCTDWPSPPPLPAPSSQGGTSAAGSGLLMTVMVIGGLLLAF